MKSCSIKFNFRNGSTISASFMESTDYTNVVNELCSLFEKRTKMYDSNFSKYTKKSNILPVSKIEQIKFLYDNEEIDLSMSFKDISSKLLRNKADLLDTLTHAFGDFNDVLQGQLSHLNINNN